MNGLRYRVKTVFFNAISYSFIKRVVINVQGIGSEMSNTHVGVFSFSSAENRRSCTVGLEDLIYILNTVHLSLWR